MIYDSFIISDKLSTLSVHYISWDGSSHQLLEISTGPWGLESVYNEFETCLAEIIGIEQMQRFKSEHWFEHFDLVESFKKKFRALKSSDSLGITIHIPVSMAECVLENISTTLIEALSLSKYSWDVEFTCGNIIRWKRNKFIQFADNVIKQIIKQIKALLASQTSDVEAILLTGQLSESELVQNAVIKYFAKIPVLPLNTKMAVLKGAVYTGHLVNSEY